MSLAPGSSLGPYEILAVLGAGGMGEVYRARDPRLQRIVAIKVLHSAFAADPGQQARFEREARAVALLNHPNILQVYDSGVHEGMPYLVMELLEGQTLRERIDGRPLAVRKALDIAIQVARGLAVAHDKQIIHRDLKPDNIFVEPDGRVKILDFGLAKLLSPPSGDDPELTRGQHPTQGLTQAGTLVGTAGYMSPEQVNGWSVDHRSDIFSFGIILFEMVTGHPPFRRGTLVETMHAILKDEPAEPEPELRLPPSLERTIQRCLEKNPRQRFQTAADLIFNLEGASMPQSSASLSQAQAPAPARPERRLPGWTPRAGLAAGVLVLLGLSYALGRRGGGLPPLVYHRLTYRRGVVQGARFSPDGQTFVFSLTGADGSSQLLAGRTDGVGARPLTGFPEGTQILSISSAGEMALLFRKGADNEGTLALAPLAGGAAREVQERVYAADWGPGGQDLAVLRREDGRYALDYPQGHRIYLGPPVTPSILDNPRVSPKGDRVAFLEHLGIGRENLSVVDLQGRRTVLVQGACDSLQWAPDGSRVFFTFHHSDDRRDLRSVTLAGRQQVLDTLLGSLRIQDISSAGRLLVGQSVEKSTLMFRGPDDRADRDLSWLTSSGLADMSADGGRVLLGETLEGAGPGGAYLRPTAGGDAVRLGDGDPLSLSPDGKWALVLSMDNAKSLSLFPTGAGAPRLLVRDVRADWAVFVAGGRQVLLGGTGRDGVFRGYLQDVAGGEPRPWPGPVTPEAYCVVAPGGNQVALGPMDGKLVICALDGTQVGSVAGVQDGEIPVQWQASGKAIYLADLTAIPGRVSLLDLTSGRRTSWKTIGPADRSGVDQIKGLSISPDGRALAYSFNRVLTSDLYVTDPVP